MRGIAITIDVTRKILENMKRDTFMRVLREEQGMPVQAQEGDRSVHYDFEEALCPATGREVFPTGEIESVAWSAPAGESDFSRLIEANRCTTA